MFTQRHLARSFEKSSLLSLPMMAGMIAGILLGAAGGNSGLGAAAAIGISAAGQQAQINYTRANEKEADRVGMRYLALSGYDPEGMPGFFKKLERKNRYVGKNYPEFLRTHPITINRIAESAQRAEQYKRSMTRFNSSLSYRLMKAKLTVISAASSKQVVQYYRAKTEKNSLAIHPEYYYGHGLALFKQQSYSQAIKVLRALKASDPDNIAYTNALAKAYIASEETIAVNAGLKLLSTVSKNNPYNLVITANYAYALMQTGQLSESISLLESFNKNNFKHPLFINYCPEPWARQAIG